MTCGLFVAHQHKTEAGFIIDCIVYRQNRAAWNAENILDARSSSERTSASAPVIFSPSTMVCFSVVAAALGMPLNACRGVGNTMFPLIFARGTFLQGYAAAFRCTQSAEPHHRKAAQSLVATCESQSFASNQSMLSADRRICRIRAIFWRIAFRGGMRGRIRSCLLSTCDYLLVFSPLLPLLSLPLCL